MATTTERGTWVAPDNRVTWTPPRFEHSHRFYGSTDVRVVMIPAELCAALVTHPSVFTVSPQLREALLALMDRKDRRAEMNDRPRAVTDLLRADFGQSTSLTELGRGAGARVVCSALSASDFGSSTGVTNVSRTDQNPVVVVIGAGVAGLAVGNFLLRNGIGCVVLEKHRRNHVEQRQRAGSLDGRSVRTFRDWGLGEVVNGHVSHAEFESDGMPLRIDGETRMWKPMDDGDDDPGVFCPQQVLVRNLIESSQPKVRYRDASGATTELGCDFVAGCDGYRGASRASVPDGVLTPAIPRSTDTPGSPCWPRSRPILPR